jgi:hypothetical protein
MVIFAKETVAYKPEMWSRSSGGVVFANRAAELVCHEAVAARQRE